MSVGAERRIPPRKNGVAVCERGEGGISRGHGAGGVWRTGVDSTIRSTCPGAPIRVARSAESREPRESLTFEVNRYSRQGMGVKGKEGVAFKRTKTWLRRRSKREREKESKAKA